MHSVYALLLVAVLVLALGRITFHPARWPLWVQVMFQSGLVYLLMGPLLGPVGLNLVRRESLSLLDPALNLALSWVGLVFGLQLRLRDLKRISGSMWRLSLAQYLLAATVSFLLAWTSARWLLPDAPLRVWILVGVLAGSSSPTLMAIILRDLGLQSRPAARVALLSGNLDNLYALSCLILVSLLGAPHHQLADKMPLLLALMTPIVISVILAWIFHYFLHRAMRESQFALLLVGTMTFAGGAAALLKISPLAMGLMIGLWLANQSRDANRLYHFMVSHEKPVFLGLILMAGLLWQPEALQLHLLISLSLVLMLGRALAKRFGLHLHKLGEQGAGGTGGEFSGPLRWLLLPMGGLPLAIALSEVQLMQEQDGLLVLAITLPLVLLSLLASTLLMTRKPVQGKEEDT